MIVTRGKFSFNPFRAFQRLDYTVALNLIYDVDVKKTLFQYVFGGGDVYVRTASNDIFHLEFVADPHKVRHHLILQSGIKNKPEYQRLETARFVRQHNITRYQHNPFFPVNTLMIMRGAVAAQQLGIFERYVDEVYRHMWAEPKKLDDPAVLRAALLESDLPADRLFELVQTAPVKEALMAETQRAVDRGTFGSPTFFVDDDIYFGKDRLRDVEEAIVAKR